jgi:hypothetical protein
MSVVIYKKIENDLLERTLHKIEEYRPITCFGASLRHEIKRSLKWPRCRHSDTAEEYENYLSDHGVLLEDPR